jgi:hypothetical protein
MRHAGPISRIAIISARAIMAMRRPIIMGRVASAGPSGPITDRAGSAVTAHGITTGATIAGIITGASIGRLIAQ